MKPIPVKTAVFVLGLLSAANIAAAQDDGPTIKFNFFEVEDAHLVIGRSFVIDAEYGAEHNLAVAAPFRFVAPTGDDFLVGQQPTPGSDTFVKIAYATLDREFIENFQFVPMRVDMGAEEARLNGMAKILAEQAFGMVVEPYQDPTRDGVRKIEVGGNPAIEVFGRYRDPANGAMYTRLVGILNPNSEHCVFLIANIVAQRLPLENPDELATKTRSGAALKTFRYID